MRYRLLGPLQVVRDDSPVDIGPPKQRAALAVLLLAQGRVVSVDRLIELLPDLLEKGEAYFAEKKAAKEAEKAAEEA